MENKKKLKKYITLDEEYKMEKKTLEKECKIKMTLDIDLKKKNW